MVFVIVEKRHPPNNLTGATLPHNRGHWFILPWTLHREALPLLSKTLLWVTLHPPFKYYHGIPSHLSFNTLMWGTILLTPWTLMWAQLPTVNPTTYPNRVQYPTQPTNPRVGIYLNPTKVPYPTLSYPTTPSHPMRGDTATLHLILSPFTLHQSLPKKIILILKPNIFLLHLMILT